MRKQMTLIDIQQESLKILLDVDRFCRENDIKYSLGYGTLIGAIRHNGFIPWDDDIDIVMTRPEFDKFCKLYHSDRYKKSVPGDAYIAFARVYDICDTYVEQTDMPWIKGDTGVWIDVFSLDNVTDDRCEFEQLAADLVKIWNEEFIARSLFVPFAKKSLSKKIKAIIKRIIYREPISSIIERHLQKMKLHAWGTTGHCSQLCCADNITGEWIPFEKLNGYMDVDFEGHKLSVFKEYDSILRSYYGDYMQLPPKEQQIPKQDGSMNFYWK